MLLFYGVQLLTTEKRLISRLWVGEELPLNICPLSNILSWASKVR